ncbi:MAG TPA: replication-associated recombination protein A [Verrucomicrobiales bacterium]|nr:replication-associated recombination protein A [Verrucomicrobiales bacterium]
MKAGPGDDLFPEQSGPDTPSSHTAENPDPGLPLAARMRPRSLPEFIGQEHILGPGKLLRRAVEADRFTALILYGPPGTGKTSLAEVIARRSASRFVNVSGVESTVADLRREVESAAQLRRINGRSTILFVDEIHRFNKAQQDVLLPHVERGVVRFIGATTHNPYFYVNSPLVSRAQVFQLEPLPESGLEELLAAAVRDRERGLGELGVDLDAAAAKHLARVADGDARKCLSALELAVLTTPPGPGGRIHITLSIAAESIQTKALVYDGDGDAHYDTISAFIKSMRGSDPDAALYWLAKMLHAGEDPRFIARRIVIAASEDVGLADSNALRVAVAAQQALEFLGMPEGRIPLAHATVYVATAPKSNRAYAGLESAQRDIREGRTLPVPAHLRDASYAGAKRLGHGEGYLYSHDFEGAYVPQAYLPEGRRYYEPSAQGAEQEIAERLAAWREQFERARESTG